ncbi:MAG: PAS domain S-box protein [Syntrophobacteraceae bacterium]
MNSSSKMKKSGLGSISFRIALTYFLVGAFWILFSDKALGLLISDPALLTTASMIKGWGFVSATSLILYAMLGRWTSRIERFQEKARLTEAKYRKVVEGANSIIIRMDRLGNVTFINGFAQRFFGYTEEELLGKNVVETIAPPVETGGRDFRRMIEDIGIAPERYARSIHENNRRNGERVWVSWTNMPLWDQNGRISEILCVGNDITERRQAEEERELIVEFLRLVNESGNSHELVYEATAFFRKRSGCEAVGIRLRREHDYPYYETRGFSPEFVRLESRLCALDKNGQPVLDGFGNPVLECMCGNVICGRFDPSKPFFTSSGSFWTNSTSELLSTSTEADRQARTRNRCNGQGYESVALIALRAGNDRIGLLQLNDRTKGRFTPQRIALWERLSNYLSVALSRFLAQEALVESEQRYRELFEAGSDGVLFVDTETEMILDANNSASAMLGYNREELLGRKNRELSAEPEETRRKTQDAQAAPGQVITVPQRRLRRKDGTGFPAELTGRSFLWKNRPVFIVAIRDITERLKAEEVKARLAAIVESSSDAIIGKALDGTITSWNLGAQKIYQYTAQEVVGKSIKLLFPDGLSEDMDVILEKVKSGKYVEPYETVRRRRDGLEIHVSLSISPILDGSGSIIGASSVARDITRQKQIRDALRESEERFRSVVTLSPVAMGLMRNDGVITFQNDRYTQLFGYTPDDISTIREWWQRAYPEDEYRRWARESWRAAEKRAAPEDGVIGPVEYRVTRKDGAERLVDMTGIRIGDEVLACFIDLTERKRAELEKEKLQSALVAAGNRIALHFQQTPLAIMEFTCDGVVREWNPAAEKMFGFLRDEAVGQHWRIIVPDEKRDEIEKVWNSVVMGDSNSKSINENRTKDGRLIVCDWLNTKLVDSKGRVIGVASFVQDITDRKLAEQERDKLQQQLLQSRKMESVGRLAGGVAHDYNNMLGVIIGYTEMTLTDMSRGDPLQANLHEVLKAANRSADITRQLLAFARKQTISPKVLDLNETVEGMLKMLRRLIGEDIDLAWLPGAGLSPVTMDPSQIDQILANLCVNARDAIDGVGKVTIETDRVAFDEAYCVRHDGFIPGQFVLLAVSDDGCGMEKETLESIFEPFFTTKEVNKGTGLGLSTVYGIARQNGGFINVYSEPGHGTTFKVYLPAAREQVSQEDALSEKKRDLRGAETILLVEDEESILALGKAILERHGYTVLAARNPTDALSLARSHSDSVHLLITDVVMPEMNGRELRDRLQGLQYEFKCIYMSGYTANVIAHHGVLDEGIEFLQKPFSVRTLTEKVRDVLDA